MKNENIKPIDPVKKILTEAGIDNPGDRFHLSVLKKIERLSQRQYLYEPVISALVWKVILGFISSTFIWGLLFLPADAERSSWGNSLPPFQFPSPDYGLYNFTYSIDYLSPHLLLGICAFFALGFLVIVNTLQNKQAEV